jgi:hypothetical protein
MMIIVSIAVLLLVFREARIVKRNQFLASILFDSYFAKLVNLLPAYFNKFL